MLKMYHKRIHSGSSPDFWEENWAASEFEESVRFMGVDPLRPLFNKYLRPESLMLEGGCGMGNYIVYYAAKGFDVVGLDFAQQALKTLSIRRPGLKLVGGDVSNMPFGDKTFDLYYSGGVVEHFESGAEGSLHEARRVLKDDGVLLISVPYFSPLRRMLAPFRNADWRHVSAPMVDGRESDELRFFQYAYRKHEFKKMLSSAGLRTIETQGYAILWGIRDLPFFQDRGNGEFPRVSSEDAQAEPSFADVTELTRERPVSLLKRLVVREDDTVPVLGLGVRIMRWSAANMMMYVCKRSP